ncbi:Zn-dependent alcohol dehydrogenase [Deltaproteobacteria bacterium]|jgi:Zn-dependent alcohol dehydrogenase|nr:Zn-dependent alcohol dehydrogenase [Deltaproteobacteria bacterium]
MKAAICREFGKPLVIEEVELLPPRTGEVQVKLAACAICHSDILYTEGAWGGELPAVYGHEASGVVESVGAGVTAVQQGDHVLVTLIRSCGTCHYCSKGDKVRCETTFPLDEQSPLRTLDGKPITQGLRTGAFAESVVVDASQLAPIPKDVPLDSASILSCGVITGFGAVVNTAQITSGSSVVVIGTGGVGLNSVQGAAVAGAERIIALDLSDAKLEASKQFGATHTVNVEQGNARKAVKSLTGGRGADYVFVTVGSKSALEQGFKLLCKGGTLVIVGMTADGVKIEFDSCAFASVEQRLLGSKMGSTRLTTDIPWYISLYQQDRLKLDELISARYPLENINEAIADVSQGDALRNVIVF